MAESTSDISQFSNEESLPASPIVFMGTPDLSRDLLEALIEKKYPIAAVVTKPDWKSGRKGELQKSPVKVLAEAHTIPVLTPKRLDDEFYEALKEFKPALILVAAYGKILPERILLLPQYGALNIHYSLLPRFRGASPIQHALLFGDTETGITLMKMDQGLDTGEIIAVQKVPIDPNDTAKTLTPKLTEGAKTLVLTALPLWLSEKIGSAPQPEEGIVLCQLIERSDGKIEWTDSAQDIYNRYRAFDPWPGVFTFWKHEDSFTRIKILEMEIFPGELQTLHQLGEVFQVGEQILAQTGNGAIVLKTIQPEGKSSMTLKDFLNGSPEFVGEFLV